MQSDEVLVFFFFWPVCDDDRDTQKKANSSPGNGKGAYRIV